ncbi:FCP1 homology domain [Dillenia turbinata]|uniref:Mitochondrial import inner membrane translocase subunit TIM50 n=1 Tax=Dillenia turbinata TaxID=194707 RepID=A0AAN8ZNK0_9MAGN
MIEETPSGFDLITGSAHDIGLRVHPYEAIKIPLHEKMASLKSEKVVLNEGDEANKIEDNSSISLCLEKLNIGPQKKLLVFSFNRVLMNRIYRTDKVVPRNRRPDGVYRAHLVYKRPYCEGFVKFCFERFEVGIWSSAEERNILGALDNVLGAEFKKKLLFVWDQNDCIDTGFQSLENENKPLFLKDLLKIWELWPGRFSPSNTLLIDERPYKALINPPCTGIFPEPYRVENPGDDALGPKGELRMYLKGLADVEDVPSYVKEHKFGQPAIAPGHPDWGFYVKVLDKYGPAIIQQDMKTAPSEAHVKNICSVQHWNLCCLHSGTINSTYDLTDKEGCGVDAEEHAPKPSKPYCFKLDEACLTI